MYVCMNSLLQHGFFGSNVFVQGRIGIVAGYKSCFSACTSDFDTCLTIGWVQQFYIKTENARTHLNLKIIHGK